MLKLVSNGEEVTVSANEPAPVRDAQLACAARPLRHAWPQAAHDDVEWRRSVVRNGAEEDDDEDGGEPEAEAAPWDRDRAPPAIGIATAIRREREHGSSSSKRQRDGERAVPAVLSGGSGGAASDRWVRESIRVRVIDFSSGCGQRLPHGGRCCRPTSATRARDSVRMDERRRFTKGCATRTIVLGRCQRGGLVLKPDAVCDAGLLDGVGSEDGERRRALGGRCTTTTWAAGCCCCCCCYLLRRHVRLCSTRRTSERRARRVF